MVRAIRPLPLGGRSSSRTTACQKRSRCGTCTHWAAGQICKQGCSLSEIAGGKIVPHNAEALMDLGLVILPPFASQRAGDLFWPAADLPSNLGTKQDARIGASLRDC